MTRKDFELIAETLKKHKFAPDYKSEYERGNYEEWKAICHSLATALATTDPAFDRARFLAACGL